MDEQVNGLGDDNNSKGCGLDPSPGRRPLRKGHRLNAEQSDHGMLWTPWLVGEDTLDSGAWINHGVGTLPSDFTPPAPACCTWCLDPLEMREGVSEKDRV